MKRDQWLTLRITHFINQSMLPQLYITIENVQDRHISSTLE